MTAALATPVFLTVQPGLAALWTIRRGAVVEGLAGCCRSPVHRGPPPRGRATDVRPCTLGEREAKTVDRGKVEGTSPATCGSRTGCTHRRPSSAARRARPTCSRCSTTARAWSLAASSVPPSRSTVSAAADRGEERPSAAIALPGASPRDSPRAQRYSRRFQRPLDTQGRQGPHLQSRRQCRPAHRRRGGRDSPELRWPSAPRERTRSPSTPPLPHARTCRDRGGWRSPGLVFILYQIM